MMVTLDENLKKEALDLFHVHLIMPITGAIPRYFWGEKGRG